MRKQRRRSASRLRSGPLFSLHGYYNLSTFKIRNFKPLAIFCGCTAWFVSDLVGNHEDRFSHNEAHIYLGQSNSADWIKKTISGSMESLFTLNGEIL